MLYGLRHDLTSRPILKNCWLFRIWSWFFIIINPYSRLYNLIYRKLYHSKAFCGHEQFHDVIISTCDDFMCCKIRNKHFMLAWLWILMYCSEHWGLQYTGSQNLTPELAFDMIWSQNQLMTIDDIISRQNWLIATWSVTTIDLWKTWSDLWLAVSSSPRQWIDVFAWITRKIQHGSDSERSRPQGLKMSITF